MLPLLAGEVLTQLFLCVDGTVNRLLCPWARRVQSTTETLSSINRRRIYEAPLCVSVYINIY
jgi:hypothetical protein